MMYALLGIVVVLFVVSFIQERKKIKQQKALQEQLAKAALDKEAIETTATVIEDTKTIINTTNTENK